MAGTLGIVGSVVGIGSGLESLFGGGGGGSQQSTGGAGNQMYVPTGLGRADQSWQQQMMANQGQLEYGGGLANAVDPALMQSFNTAQGIDYNPYLQASQQAGQQYAGLSGLAGQAGQMSMQQAMQNFTDQQRMQGAGEQAMQQGFNLAQPLQGAGMGTYGQMQGLGQMSQGAGMQGNAQQQQLAGQALGVGGQMAGAGMQGADVMNSLGATSMGVGAQTGQQIGQLGRGLQGQGQSLYGDLQGIGRSMEGIGGGNQAAMSSLAQPIQQAGQAAYQAAFDPRQAQYSKGLQQVMDQSNAINSMYGLGSSGQGAGIAAQNVQNYNTDWQNQQLQRELQGVNAITGAQSAAGGLINQGAQSALQGYQGAAGANLGGAQGMGALTGLAGNLYGQGGQMTLQGLQQGGGMVNQGFGNQMAGLQGQAGQLGQASGMGAAGMGQMMGGLNQAGNMYQGGLSGLTGASGTAGALGQGGVGAMSGAYKTGGGLGAEGGANLQAGMGYYGMQPGFTQNSAQTPLNAVQYAAGMPRQNALDLIGGMSQAMTPYMQMQNQAVPYMNYGSGAGANAFQNNLANRGFQANQQQAGMSTLLNPNTWSGLQGLFGSGGGSNPFPQWGSGGGFGSGTGGMGD